MTGFLLVFESEFAKLARTEFTSGCGSYRSKCVRGKDTGGYPGATGTFQWTPAVKALSILIIRYHLGSKGACSPDDSVLRGGGGSPAATLDYAISKQPEWLCEMFGVTKAGEPRAKGIFKRLNPERKRGGDVVLSVNPKAITPETISLQWDNGDDIDPASALRLLRELEGDEARTILPLLGKTRENEKVIPIVPDNMYEAARHILHSWVEEELTESLFGTETFTTVSQKSLLSRLQSDSAIKHAIGGRRSRFAEFFDLEDAGRIPLRPDLAKRIESQFNSVRLFTTIAQVGTIALFMVLKRHLGIELDIVLDSPHTPALLRRANESGVSSQSVDLFSLALGACGSALEVLSSSSILPITILPGVSYEFVGKSIQGINDAHRGELFLFNEPGSTSSLYWRHLQAAGVATPRGLKLVRSEPAEVLASMSEKEDRCGAILWFPHHRVNSLVTNSTRMISLRKQFGLSESFLLGKSTDSRNVPILRQMVRYAWLQLRVDPLLRRDIVKELVTSPEYFTAFLTFTGMHSHLPRIPDLLREKSAMNG